MIKTKLFSMLLIITTLLLSPLSHAHHSFAVYYDSKKIIRVEGIVENFRFTNPHAIIHLKAHDDSGAEITWTVETTAPVFMARRGWAKDTIKSGQQIVIEGWQSRDGSNLMRMRAAFDTEGKQISGSMEANDN